MPLPQLRPPSIAPDFLLDGHAVQLGSKHDTVPLQQGETRKRKVQTYAPRIVDVSWLLDRPEVVEAVDSWLETDLDVLHQPLTERVAPVGATGMYWAAQWVAPPAWEFLHFGRARLTGQLRLTGVGSDTPPGPVALAIEYDFALTGTAQVLNPKALAIEYELTLNALQSLSIDYILAVQAVVFDRELREDGGQELREDGGDELMEV